MALSGQQVSVIMTMINNYKAFLLIADIANISVGVFMVVKEIIEFHRRILICPFLPFRTR